MIFVKKYYIYKKIYIWLILIFLLNENFYEINNIWSSTIINIKLLNGLFFIHPWLNYIFLTMFISVFYFIDFYRIEIKNVNFLKNYLIKFFKTNFYIIFISICLGSWWAQQELDWGGWWSWDLIEFISLLYCAFVIYIIHFSKYNSLNILFNYVYMVIFFLIFFLILIRYNQIFSIHNFLGLTEINQWFFIFLILLLILLLSFLLFFFILNFKKINYFNVYLFIFFNLVFFILIYKHIVSYYEIEDNLINYGDIIKLFILYFLYFFVGLMLINKKLFFLIIFNLTSIYIIFNNFYKDNKYTYIYFFHFNIYLIIIISFFSGFSWYYILKNFYYNAIDNIFNIINLKWEYSYYIFNFKKNNIYFNTYINSNFIESEFNKNEILNYQEIYYYFFNKINFFLDLDTENIEFTYIFLYNIFNLFIWFIFIIIIVIFYLKNLNIFKINNKNNYLI